MSPRSRAFIFKGWKGDWKHPAWHSENQSGLHWEKRSGGGFWPGENTSVFTGKDLSIRKSPIHNYISFTSLMQHSRILENHPHFIYFLNATLTDIQVHNSRINCKYHPPLIPGKWIGIKSSINIGSEFLKSEFSENSKSITQNNFTWLTLPFLWGGRGGEAKEECRFPDPTERPQPVLPREAMGDCRPPEPISLVLHTT